MVIKATGKGSSGGPSLKKAIQTILKYPRTRVEHLKKLIYSKYHITAEGYQKFYDTLDKATPEAQALNKILQQIYVDDNPTFIKYSSLFNKWNNRYRKTDERMHPHHSEYSNIATQLRLIYEALLEIKNDPSIEFGQKDGRNAIVWTGKDKIRVSDTETYTGSQGNEPVKVDRSNLIQFKGQLNTLLPKVTEQFRNLYMTALAIARTDLDGNISDMNKITQNFVDSLNQTTWEAIKDKHIAVMDGKGKMSLTITSPEINRMLGNMEGELGKWSQDLLKAGNIPSTKWDQIQEKVDFSKLQGSKSIRNEVVEQLTDALVKGRSKKYRKKTKRTTTLKSKKRNKVNRVKTTISKASKLGAARGLSRESGDKGNSGIGQQEDLFKLTRVINKRLSAETRRNMGRPALMNRTGRFSNSVELLRLNQTPKGLSGEYTYRLNPYATFENLGEKRWPVGYNPKLLITKSIKSLALQYTEQKITYLRRT